MTRPPLQTIALASRSKGAPVVERASQPSPTSTCVRFGAALDRETLPPLASVTPIPVPSQMMFLRWYCASGAARKPCGAGRCGRTRRPGSGVPARDVAVSEVHAEVLRDAAQAGGVALADGA